MMKKIIDVQKRLELGHLPHIPKSYASMVAERLHRMKKERTGI